jgi:hypothetical protein
MKLICSAFPTRFTHECIRGHAISYTVRNDISQRAQLFHKGDDKIPVPPPQELQTLSLFVQFISGGEELTTLAMENK